MKFMSTHSPTAGTAGVPVAERPETKDDEEKNGIHRENAAGEESDAVSVDAQRGVQKIEATTRVWSGAHLVAAYILCAPL